MNYKISHRSGKYLIMTKVVKQANLWLFRKESRIWVRSDVNGNPSDEANEPLKGFDNIDEAFKVIEGFNS